MVKTLSSMSNRVGDSLGNRYNACFGFAIID